MLRNNKCILKKGRPTGRLYERSSIQRLIDVNLHILLTPPTLSSPPYFHPAPHKGGEFKGGAPPLIDINVPMVDVEQNYVCIDVKDFAH